MASNKFRQKCIQHSNKFGSSGAHRVLGGRFSAIPTAMETRGWERCLARTLYAAWTKQRTYQPRPENNGGMPPFVHLLTRRLGLYDQRLYQELCSFEVGHGAIPVLDWLVGHSVSVHWEIFITKSNVMCQLYQKKFTPRFLSV